MKITTKAIFSWDNESQTYKETHCDYYLYDGKIDYCQGQGAEDLLSDIYNTLGFSIIENMGTELQHIAYTPGSLYSRQQPPTGYEEIFTVNEDAGIIQVENFIAEGQTMFAQQPAQVILTKVEDALTVRKAALADKGYYDPDYGDISAQEVAELETVQANELIRDVRYKLRFLTTEQFDNQTSPYAGVILYTMEAEHALESANLNTPFEAVAHAQQAFDQLETQDYNSDLQTHLYNVLSSRYWIEWLFPDLRENLEDANADDYADAQIAISPFVSRAFQSRNPLPADHFAYVPNPWQIFNSDEEVLEMVYNSGSLYDDVASYIMHKESVRLITAINRVRTYINFLTTVEQENPLELAPEYEDVIELLNEAFEKRELTHELWHRDDWNINTYRIPPYTLEDATQTHVLFTEAFSTAEQAYSAIPMPQAEEDRAAMLARAQVVEYYLPEDVDPNVYPGASGDQVIAAENASILTFRADEVYGYLPDGITPDAASEAQVEAAEEAAAHQIIQGVRDRLHFLPSEEFSLVESGIIDSPYANTIGLLIRASDHSHNMDIGVFYYNYLEILEFVADAIAAMPEQEEEDRAAMLARAQVVEYYLPEDVDHNVYPGASGDQVIAAEIEGALYNRAFSVIDNLAIDFPNMGLGNNQNQDSVLRTFVEWQVLYSEISKVRDLITTHLLVFYPVEEVNNTMDDPEFPIDSDGNIKPSYYRAEYEPSIQKMLTAISDRTFVGQSETVDYQPILDLAKEALDEINEITDQRAVEISGFLGDGIDPVDAQPLQIKAAEELKIRWTEWLASSKYQGENGPLITHYNMFQRYLLEAPTESLKTPPSLEADRALFLEEFLLEMANTISTVGSFSMPTIDEGGLTEDYAPKDFKIQSTSAVPGSVTMTWSLPIQDDDGGRPVKFGNPPYDSFIIYGVDAEFENIAGNRKKPGTEIESEPNKHLSKVWLDQIHILNPPVSGGNYHSPGYIEYVDYNVNLNELYSYRIATSNTFSEISSQKESRLVTGKPVGKPPGRPTWNYEGMGNIFRLGKWFGYRDNIVSWLPPKEVGIPQLINYKLYRATSSFDSDSSEWWEDDGNQLVPTKIHGSIPSSDFNANIHTLKDDTPVIISISPSDETATDALDFEDEDLYLDKNYWYQVAAVNEYHDGINIEDSIGETKSKLLRLNPHGGSTIVGKVTDLEGKALAYPPGSAKDGRSAKDGNGLVLVEIKGSDHWSTPPPLPELSLIALSDDQRDKIISPGEWTTIGLTQTDPTNGDFSIQGLPYGTIRITTFTGDEWEDTVREETLIAGGETISEPIKLLPSSDSPVPDPESEPSIDLNDIERDVLPDDQAEVIITIGNKNKDSNELATSYRDESSN